MNGQCNGIYHCNVPRDRSIAVIGAGVAGIATAAALSTAGYTHFVVYDKNDGIGGVWHHNYPGATGAYRKATVIDSFCRCIFLLILFFIYQCKPLPNSMNTPAFPFLPKSAIAAILRRRQPAK